MSDFLRTGNTPSISALRYGSNLLECTVFGTTYTPSQNISSIILAAPNETVPTQYGNGFSLGDGGPQILTAPVAELDTTYLPSNPPVGSLCLDSTMGITTMPIIGTSDLWVKTGANATDWAPCSQAYWCIGGPITGGNIVTNNAVTFIDMISTTTDRYTSRWGNSYGAINGGVGNKTSNYLDGFYVKVPFSSYYLIWSSVGLEAPSTNLTYLMYTSIYVNGAEIKRGFRNNFLQTTTKIKCSQTSVCAYLYKDDIISFVALQTSGANRTTADVYYTGFGVVNLGA